MKRRLWKKYIATRTRYDRENYIRYKNRLRALTRNLRQNFEQNLAYNVKDKPKLFWKYVKSRLKSIQSIPPLLKPDGSKASTPIEKANTLNDFFASVFTIEDNDNIPPIQSYHVEEALQGVEITPEMVKKKLNELNPNKSTGHDMASIFLNKTCR